MPQPGGPSQPLAGDPASLCPRRRVPASRLPAPTQWSRTARLTQSPAIWLLPGQVPLQVGAEEQERVIVRGFLHLARKADRSQKVPGEGKKVDQEQGTLLAAQRSKLRGSPCLPESRDYE